MAKFGLTEERFAQLCEAWDNDLEQIECIVNDWGVEQTNKGYAIFDYDGDGILGIERIDDIDAFADDMEAVEQAIKDGVKIIPVEELPENFDKKWLGWIDTPENRARIAELAEKYPNDSLV